MSPSCAFRSKLQRDQDRDISELIALGQPNPRPSSEAQYDQRLFNQSKVGRHPPMSAAMCEGVDDLQPYR